MGSKLVWDQSCHEVKVFGDKINGIKVGLRAKLSWSQSFWGQSKWDQSWFGIKVVMKSKFFRTKKMGSKLVWGQKKMGSKLSGQSFRGKVEYNQKDDQDFDDRFDLGQCCHWLPIQYLMERCQANDQRHWRHRGKHLSWPRWLLSILLLWFGFT